MKTTTKKCPRCSKTKKLSSFPKKGRQSNGKQRYGYCKPCHAEYQNTHYIQRLFNLSVSDLEKILSFQENLCAICKRPAKGKKRLAVDHSHKDGLIRGCLCWICNRALGMLQDDPNRVKNMLDFLISPPATVALGGARYGQPGRTSSKAKTRRRLRKHLEESNKFSAHIEEKETNK